MDPSTPLVDFAPTLRLALLALVIAVLPLAWVWLRQRDADPMRRLAALTALTLFLTFDLIVFGSFTRLTDSGLGCPDWPGCYGAASPIGARADIHAAETAMPSGPVTWTKAWIEMIHRYIAMMVGVLILVMALFAWREHLRRPGALPFSPWWPTATLVWVIVQGLFGKYTVTLKLYPAVVTLHLLGGIALLVLLAIQHEAFRGRPIALAAPLRRASVGVAALLGVQIALGGWVSTNYAVLACTGFPQCNGQWWPPMDFASGFEPLRELGRTAAGAALPFDALVAIHMVHRLAAVVVVAALLWLGWRLQRAGDGLDGPVERDGPDGPDRPDRPGRPGRPDGSLTRFGLGLVLLALAQVASGLSNVVLGWPIAAALAHSAGAAALMLLLALLLARARTVGG